MGEWDDTNASRFSGQPAREPSDACAEDSVLAAVLRAASESHDDDPAGAALDALVSALGLSRASLAVVRDDGDLRRLVPVAAAGEHASFARDMPAVPLEQMADAAVAVAERRAHYVGDVHGIGSQAEEPESGIARWRTGMSVQAHALLPVVAQDRVVGLLTVEWSTTQVFTDEERASLEVVALLFGFVLDAGGGSPDETGAGEPGAIDVRAQAAAAGEAEAAAAQRIAQSAEGVLPAPEEESGVTLFGYGVTDRGVVVPDSAEGTLSEELALHILIAAGEATETACPFWEVVGVGPHSLVIIGGVVQASRGDVESLAGSCAATLRASCVQGRSPAEALHVLGKWLLTSGPGNAWVSATCRRIDPGRGIAVSAVAGAVATAHRASDGRTAVEVAEQPSLGANAGLIATDSYDLVLPGDSIAACVGSVAWARADAGRQALSRVLARDDDSTSSNQAARRLAGLSADSSITPLVTLIDVLGR